MSKFVHCSSLLASNCCYHPAPSSTFFSTYTDFYCFSSPKEATICITVHCWFWWFKLGKWHSWVSDWSAGRSTTSTMENIPCPCSSCNSILVFSWLFYVMYGWKMKFVSVHFIFIGIGSKRELDFQQVYIKIFFTKDLIFNVWLITIIHPKIFRYLQCTP